MMQAPKNTPRFLPTLTEVVNPVQWVPEVVVMPESEVQPSPAMPGDARVAQAVAQLLPALEQRIRAALQESFQSHLDAVLPQLMADVQETVEAAMADPVAHHPQWPRPD